jgi:hypothetical protein
MATRKTLPTKLKRKRKTVSILGCEMEFLEPGTLQRAKIMDFIIQAMSHNLLSPQAKSSMTPTEIAEYLKPHLEEYQELSAKATGSLATTEDHIRLMVLTGSLFSHPHLNLLLKSAIEECFPGVSDGSLLNDEALGTMYGLMMEEVSQDEDSKVFKEALKAIG